MADSLQSQNYILSFLENIKYKKNFLFPSDTNIVYRHVLLVYFIIFAGQPLFCYEARKGLDYSVNPGPGDI